MAGDEYEAQEVIADVIVERGVEILAQPSPAGLQFAAKLLVLA